MAPGAKTTEGLKAAIRGGASLGGAWTAMVGAVTAVHAAGALAGHEAGTVRTLATGCAISAIAAAFVVAGAPNSIVARGGLVALMLVVALATLFSILYGVDLLVAQPFDLRQGTAGALVGAAGAVMLLVGRHFPRRRG